MHRRRWSAALVGLSLAALTACGAAGEGVDEADEVQALGASIERTRPAPDPAVLGELTSAQAAFAIETFRTALAQAEDPDADLVLGPASLHTALSMIRAGAAGATATEMDQVLGADRVTGSLHEAQNALERELLSRGDTRGIELAIANRVWVQTGFALKPEYVRTMAEQYGAALAALDIAADPERARTAINGWVSENTAERIPELFPQGSIASNTPVVLANAVHLDANWLFPFDPANTTDQPFQLADGSTVQVPTMKYDLYLPSGRGPGYTAVRLPYNGRQLAMTVILPDDLAAFEKNLSAATLDQIEASIKDGGIHLSLPKFSAKSRFDMNKILSAMGMPSAFGGGADFSALSDAGLQLSTVVHEAIVDVDEQGTKADAASGGVFLGSHGPGVTVDRPFLFVIRDQPTGSVLFLGRVTDPR